jgi:antitoxin component YwqK of YwqJK toxin-antitoxin module
MDPVQIQERRSDGYLNTYYHDPSGKLHGEYKTYFPNGILCEEKHYFHGELDGDLKAWYEPPGPIWQHLKYRNGQFHGVQTWWYRNGKMHIQMTFVDGLKSGESKIWYSTGQIQEQVMYWNEKLNGECVKYNEAGTLIHWEIYYDGKHAGETQRWDDNGQLIEHIFYPEPTRGERLSWRANGQIKEHIHFINEGDGHGIYKQWDENIRLQKYSLYRNGEKVADLTVRIAMSIMYLKHYWRKRTKRRIRRILDEYLIDDLGDIVMMYYYKK